MPKPKNVNKPTEKPQQLTLPLEESVALATLSNESLIDRIRKDPGQYSDVTLAPLFSSVHTLHDRLGKFLDILKTEFKRRRESWALAGDENQHRMLVCPTAAGAVEIECQTRQKFTLNRERAEALLKAKDLYSEAYDLVIETGGDQLQKFLKKHRANLVKMELSMREVLNEDKIAAMVETGELTAAEFKSMLDAENATYAILLKKALDLEKGILHGTGSERERQKI